jgi:hypothetical protein
MRQWSIRVVTRCVRRNMQLVLARFQRREGLAACKLLVADEIVFADKLRPATSSRTASLHLDRREHERWRVTLSRRDARLSRLAETTLPTPPSSRTPVRARSPSSLPAHTWKCSSYRTVLLPKAHLFLSGQRRHHRDTPRHHLPPRSRAGRNHWPKRAGCPAARLEEIRRGLRSGNRCGMFGAG